MHRSQVLVALFNKSNYSHPYNAPSEAHWLLGKFNLDRDSLKTILDLIGTQDYLKLLEKWMPIADKRLQQWYLRPGCRKCLKIINFFESHSGDNGWWIGHQDDSSPLDVVADDTGGVFEPLLHCPGKWDKSTLTNNPIFCHFLHPGGGIIRPILTRLHGPFYLGHY